LADKILNTTAVKSETGNLSYDDPIYLPNQVPSLTEGAYVVAFELVGSNGKRVLFGKRLVVGP
jgi:hypothetical protein